MKNLLIGLLLISITACGTPVSSTPAIDLPTVQDLPTVTPAPAATIPADTQEPEAEPDLFSAHDIVLPAPACDGTFVIAQEEGPYYTPDSPERNLLFEEGMDGVRLYLVGYVLDENCQPIPGAWLDFWQADAQGNYDNVGYRLRGHQFTDVQGRYFLDTVIPAEYPGRPIAHIHLKIQAPDGNVITSQLYFPSEPVRGLTVLLEERGDHTVGYFNFVVNTP
jgi:hypothetical protein